MNVATNLSLVSKDPLPAPIAGLARHAAASRVLIVGGCAESREHQESLVQSLGYACKTAPDALSALRLVATDSSIGIVLVHLSMEKLDGIFLLNEISERFSWTRPMVLVAIGDKAADFTLEVVRSGASDLLDAPLSVDALSDCLRRAVSRWTRLSHQFQVAALNPGEEVAENRQTFGAAFQAADPSFADLQELGAKLLKSRQGRANYVSEDLISEPAWSILLDLVVAGLKGERVATSSACAAAQVPLSTALRHVNQLIQAGWVKRVNDPNDKRRTFLELQPRYFDIMVSYLRATWNLFGTNPARIARHY